MVYFVEAVVSVDNLMNRVAVTKMRAKALSDWRYYEMGLKYVVDIDLPLGTVYVGGRYRQQSPYGAGSLF